MKILYGVVIGGNEELRDRSGALMDAKLLAEVEIARHDWASLQECGGNAVGIPGALKRLLEAPSADEADHAYWLLENHVVVQGQLYESAVATTQVIMAALVEPRRPEFVRISLLELLFQTVSGEAHEDEAARGLPDLGEMCRSNARQGLWVLYRELLEGVRGLAREVIEIIEPEKDRLTAIKKYGNLEDDDASDTSSDVDG